MKKYKLLILSSRLKNRVFEFGETKMGGYQTGRALLFNGSEYVVEVDNGIFLFYVEGCDYVPFAVEDIKDIIITHEKINVDAFAYKQGQVFESGLLDKHWVSEMGDSITCD